MKIESNCFNKMIHLLAMGILCLVAQGAGAVDWEAVEGKDVVLFHPGQASWEWALVPSTHSAAKKFRGGKNCADCHEGEQAEIGALIASGEKLEPSPVEGAEGSTTVNVKVARDDENLYVRFQWKNSTAPQRPPMDPDHEAMVTMMIGDENVKEAVRAGCWGTCHSDLPLMMSASDATEGMTKYLGASRIKMSREGGGLDMKPDGALQELMAKGEFMEYWQAKLNQGAVVGVVDGYILDKRHKNHAPMVSAQSEFTDGSWVVQLSRKLKTGGGAHKDFEAGKTYIVGFAIHGGYTEGRFHHVSLEYTLSLDEGDASFVARKQ